MPLHAGKSCRAAKQPTGRLQDEGSQDMSKEARKQRYKGPRLQKGIFFSVRGIYELNLSRVPWACASDHTHARANLRAHADLQVNQALPRCYVCCIPKMAGFLLVVL